VFAHTTYLHVSYDFSQSIRIIYVGINRMLSVIRWIVFSVMEKLTFLVQVR